MKLGILINNQDVLVKLYKTELNGRRALALRKVLKRLGEEIREYEEARNEYIKTHGTKNKNGDMAIEENTPEAAKFLRYVNEMATAEIDDVQPFFSESDLETLNLSVREIDQIEALGLMKAGHVDVPEPNAEIVPAAEEKEKSA